MDSIDYYNKNAKNFFDRTINADVQDLYQKFLKHVPHQGRILDAGCGVGRDSKFFLSKGYKVLAFDGSLEMVKLTSNLLGEDALHMLFQNMHFSSEFNAVWANASLLHVPYEDLSAVIEGFQKALLPSGILYASFKYGTSMRRTEDRIFFDMDEGNIEPYLNGLFAPLEIWKSADTRSTVAPSPDKSWLNFIARRI
ncbi:MAG: methyltransferase domain-containing protein [Verrucomicrobia bacterium]|nr:methyltransferase domain-containing protein [Verrucomicrobiota bacterium]MBS0646578.1 methyltransferase domain-containing protein [Verrucomicrobiota bacterium]